MKNDVTFVLRLTVEQTVPTKEVLLDVPGALNGAHVKVSGYARGNDATTLYAWTGNGKSYNGLFIVDLTCQQGYLKKPFVAGDVVDVTVTVTNPNQPPIVGGGVVVIVDP